MCRRASMACAFVVALAAGLCGAQGLAVGRLRAEGAGEAAFELVNTSKQPVVAWRYRVHAILPNGHRADAGGGSDTWRLADRPGTGGQGPILPGEAREERARIGRGVRGIAVTIEAVVYADGIAWGEPAALEAIERRRGEEAEGLRVLLGFADILKHSCDVKESLRGVLSRLSASEETLSKGRRHPDHKGHITNALVYRELRQLLDTLERKRVSPGGPTETAIVEDFERYAKREVELTVRNALKLKGSPR